MRIRHDRAVNDRWALAALVAVGCGATHPTEQPRGTPMIELRPCRIEGVGETLRCGTLEVPEDREHPEGRRLSLPVIVLPAIDGASGGPPLFELLGGPGLGATIAVDVFANDLRPLRSVGDVVLIDQRGSGVGPSALACPELDEIGADLVPDAAARRRCRDTLAERADLRFYGTVEAARDLEDARVALGYDRINLEALSYGTRVAQVYLHLFGANVRAAVLFGTIAPDTHIPEEFAEHAQRVIDAIVEDCARDAACATAYPALREQLDALATSLPASISRTAFTEWVRHQLYSAAGAARLPATIAAAASGDFTAFEGAAPLGQGQFREALRLTITCSEDVPAIDLPVAIARSRQTWFGAARLESDFAACTDWPRAPVDPLVGEVVASDVPVLVIAGERDPVTPPEHAVRATKRLPHALVVQVPGLAHEPDLGAECLLALELAFLRAPDAPVDASCASALAPLPFVLR